MLRQHQIQAIKRLFTHIYARKEAASFDISDANNYHVNPLTRVVTLTLANKRGRKTTFTFNGETIKADNLDLTNQDMVDAYIKCWVAFYEFKHVRHDQRSLVLDSQLTEREASIITRSAHAHGLMVTRARPQHTAVNTVNTLTRDSFAPTEMSDPAYKALVGRYALSVVAAAERKAQELGVSPQRLSIRTNDYPNHIALAIRRAAALKGISTTTSMYANQSPMMFAADVISQRASMQQLDPAYRRMIYTYARQLVRNVKREATARGQRIEDISICTTAFSFHVAQAVKEVANARGISTSLQNVKQVWMGNPRR